MAYTDIDKPSDYFETKLYTGTGATQSITGVNFQPDLVWLKSRNNAYNHNFFDSVRGVLKMLRPNTTNAEATISNTLTSFNSDGFTLGSDAGVNESSSNQVSWNWKAGTSFTNDASATGVGSIDSAGSVNTDAGFSIVSWTGNGADATIAHGLSQAPTIYFVKNRADAADWRVGQVLGGNIMTGGNGYYMELNDTKASTNPGSATLWGSTPTAPTSSVFTVGSNNANNGSSDAMIAYCFHSVKGYSKFGSYTGNNNANGTFVYTGMKPAFVMIKNSTTSSTSWVIQDTKRSSSSGGNPADKRLLPNATTAEATDSAIDLLSNGFKIRSTGSWTNDSANTYIYMAFAESPFVTSTGIPATAR